MVTKHRADLAHQILNFLFPPVIESSSTLVYLAPNKWFSLTNPFPPLPVSENLPASLSSGCFIVVFFPRLLKIISVPAGVSASPPPRRRQARQRESPSSTPSPTGPWKGLQGLPSKAHAVDLSLASPARVCQLSSPGDDRLAFFAGSDAEAGYLRHTPV